MPQRVCALCVVSSRVHVQAFNVNNKKHKGGIECVCVTIFAGLYFEFGFNFFWLLPGMHAISEGTFFAPKMQIT